MEALDFRVIMHDMHFINTWYIRDPLSRNFYVRTCEKLVFANKIETMYEKLHVQLCKRKSRNLLYLTFNLNTLYLTSVLFTWLKFTCVNVQSQKASLEIHPNVTLCVTDVFIRVALNLTIRALRLLAALHVHRIEIPYWAFPERGWSKNSITWKCWLFWNNWSCQWSKKKNKLQGLLENQDRGLRNQGQGSRIG